MRRDALSLFLLVFFGHAFFMGALGFNQSTRVGAILTFVEPGPDRFTLRIDEFVWNDDRNLMTGDWARGADGHFYSNKAPGISLLGIPVYAVLYGLAFTTAAGVPLLVLLFYQYATFGGFLITAASQSNPAFLDETRALGLLGAAPARSTACCSRVGGGCSSTAPCCSSRCSALGRRGTRDGRRWSRRAPRASRRRSCSWRAFRSGGEACRAARATWSPPSPCSRSSHPGRATSLPGRASSTTGRWHSPRATCSRSQQSS